MKKKKILIVGGAGFIGSYVNKLLALNNYETVVFDNLSSGNKLSVVRGSFVEGDISSKSDLANLFSSHKFDAVMHFAALIDVGASVTHPSIYYQNNVVATLNLLEKMIENNVSIFIFSSSAAVYGMPLTKLIKEDHPKNPINPYGMTKLVVENILKDYDHAYGIKSVSLRYFNAVGGDPDNEIKNYNQKSSNLVPIVINCIKNKTPLTINGDDYDTIDGTCVRDYIHIHDLATAHMYAMEYLMHSNRSTSYNLGNGRGYSVKEVIAAATNVIKKPIDVLIGPKRAGDPPYLLANSEKATHELNWSPVYTDLETMIMHAWNASA